MLAVPSSIGGISVTATGSRAFFSCSRLKKIAIPPGVTSIEDFAFSGCSKLTTAKIEATTVPSLGINGFFNSAVLSSILVPEASVSNYKAATNWSSYSNIIVGH